MPLGHLPRPDTLPDIGSLLGILCHPPMVLGHRVGIGHCGPLPVAAIKPPSLSWDIRAVTVDEKSVLRKHAMLRSRPADGQDLQGQWASLSPGVHGSGAVTQSEHPISFNLDGPEEAIFTADLQAGSRRNIHHARGGRWSEH